MRAGTATIDARIYGQGATLRSVNATRCALVLGLVAFQSAEVSESYSRIAATALWVVPGWCVAALFALAGFTAMRSVDRNGLKSAAVRTATRFVPALVLVVIATAYGLGTAVTAESRQSYLLDGDVASYLLNILGILRRTLPGVFQFNPAAEIVNPIMWIVPIAYLAAAVLAVAALRPAWRPHVLGGIGAGLAAVSLGLLVAGIDLGNPDGLAALILAGRGLCALLCFVSGAICYNWRRIIPMDGRVAGLACVVLLLVALIGDRSWFDNALVSVATAVPIAYVTIYACSLPWPLRHWAPLAEPILWRVLLLAYPIQQFWIAVGPNRQNGVVNLVLSLPVVLMLAVALWLIERRALRQLLPHGLPPFKMPPRRPISASSLIQNMRAALPILAIAALVVMLVLVAMAMTMFAMQRDAGGV